MEETEKPMAEPAEKVTKKGLCGKCPCGCGFPICLICAIIAIVILLKIVGKI